MKWRNFMCEVVDVVIKSDDYVCTTPPTINTTLFN